MIKRNPHMAQLKSGYLFPEINKRVRQFLAQHPDAALISLGIGDTTEPIPECISREMREVSHRLGTPLGYVGYGPEQGLKLLREKIAATFYENKIQSNEVFISDGAKCDIGRMQMLFGNNVSIAVQDPCYPVYVDGSIIQGVKQIVFMPCRPENNFFPDLSVTPKTDLIYFCSPNNPTGAVASKEELKKLVDFAHKNRSIIIFDSAYANFISASDLPKSIYEIDGAQEVAIETGSFSKLVGFTGIRLAWTVVPEKLKFEDGTCVKSDWNRVISTIFNGASNISQYGGIAALNPEGMREIENLTKFYMENAFFIKTALEGQGFQVYGGIHAPYLWVKFPGRKSWNVFQDLLENQHIITTPGEGFGPCGEEFIRFSAFGHRENILKAVERLKKITSE
jgi:LL-diaminopimelate aminotransferase